MGIPHLTATSAYKFRLDYLVLHTIGVVLSSGPRARNCLRQDLHAPGPLLNTTPIVSPSLNHARNPSIQCEAESINEARLAIFNIESLYLVHLIGEIYIDLPEDETLSCYGGLKRMLFVYMGQTCCNVTQYNHYYNWWRCLFVAAKISAT